MVGLGPGLINMVKHSPYREVENHLNELLNTSEADLSYVLAYRDEKEMTPLHHSVSQSNFEMTETLLNFSAPIDVKIRDKTIKDFAKEIMQNKDKEMGPKRIYVLIRSRQKLQRGSDEKRLFFRSCPSREGA